MRKILRIVAKGVLGLSVVLCVLVGAFVAMAWEPDRPVSALAGRWAAPPSTFVPVEDLSIHVRDEGPRDDPAPIVLLHGTSASLHTWDGWASELSPERRVIRFDLPGFGLTGPFPDGDYRLEAYVRVIRALLDRLEVKRYAIAGNSFGGVVAVGLTLDAPERVTHLVLVDAGGYLLPSAHVPIGFRIAKTPVLNRVMLVTLPRSVVESSLQNVYGDPSKVTPDLVDRYFELTLREGNRGAVAERFRQVPQGILEGRVDEVRAPTLILWGAKDRLIPLASGERFAREIPGSELIVFDDLGHVPHEEDPARTVAPVKELLGVAGR